MAAVVGGGELVVLDSTSYTVFARRFVERVAGETGVPGPTLLYLSHRHFDHFGGAAAIAAPVVGHRLTREGIARYDDGWIERNVTERGRGSTWSSPSSSSTRSRCCRRSSSTTG